MEEDEGEEEAIVQDDGYALLVAGGVHPLLAARAADTALPEAFVLAWALLLACMNDAGHDQRRRLGLTCGNVDRSEAGTSTAKRGWDAKLCYCETLLSMHMRTAKLGHHTALSSDAFLSSTCASAILELAICCAQSDCGAHQHAGGSAAPRGSAEGQQGEERSQAGLCAQRSSGRCSSCCCPRSWRTDLLEQRDASPW